MKHRPKHRGNRPQHRPAGRPSPESTEPRPPPGRWVIGIHSVREALKVRKAAVAELCLKQGWESSQELREISEMGKVPVTKQEGWLDRLGSGHQGVAARLTEAPELDWEVLDSAEKSIVLLLDGIQDPHNLGACLRTAWLLGVHAVFIPENRASPLTPTAMKVASGGAEHVPVVADGNLLDTAKTLKEKGYWLFGLAGEAKHDLWQTTFHEKIAIVIGNEESGIRTPLARLCDELIRIPQGAPEASFNASVAAAITLAEVARQHRSGHGKP
jgi:23S rRNA (guanosine2251-2'-O)-methyltransferase